ncbi:MAG: hypothetical protein EXX96DRAFT_614745 [Benjaminiella poitrasii]|nr:MAG: hypothetical protein EXX96DRAFT_614745 [Benjaminiella poitrasii]
MMIKQISARYYLASTTLLQRRGLHLTSIVYTEGATANSKGFKDKENAVENQWARSHDAELLKSLKGRLAEHEQSAADIKQRLSELQKSQKK